MSELSVRNDGISLSGEESGEGPAVVLLHGLTATRRYVVMGSRALERAGHRVIAYDARGHGRSEAAPDRAYGYEHLTEDLLAVMDQAGVQRAVLAGASMGAHTAVRFALAHPERMAALALVTPAFEPDSPRMESELERWDALAAGLRDNGADGFVAAGRCGAGFESCARIVRGGYRSGLRRYHDLRRARLQCRHVRLQCRHVRLRCRHERRHGP